MCNLLIKGLRLVQTCTSHPEQYDVYKNKKQVAYFRLRHGYFRAVVPDVGGEVVYEANTNGDGAFKDDERRFHLSEAVKAVKASMTGEKR